ncbi:MGMT family protein [Owenweeksia hongkongensis]|uniref:MGMT family protein n=1 Tax=Owenweeksia hongkongensis TaxID=253245 RepID=UPI003A8F270F
MADDNFFERVYAVAKLIPYGRVTSYGVIAKFIGAPKSARMVGYAMNGSISEHNIPAHRVVNRNGILSGKSHFGGSRVMEQLLQSEGISVEDDQVQDFEKVFWDPLTELNRDEFLPNNSL